MSDQPLFDYGPVVAVEGETIQERFESFHRLNPWVYAALERLTAQWLAAGHRRLGIGMLTEARCRARGQGTRLRILAGRAVARTAALLELTNDLGLHEAG